MSEDFSRPLEMIKRPDGSAGEWIKLPPRNEMLGRLIEAGGDDADLKKDFYELLLAKEGRVMDSEGIVVTLATALGDYADKNPSSEIADLWEKADKFIRALTLGAKDDPRINAIREETKRTWREVYGEPENKSQ